MKTPIAIGVALALAVTQAAAQVSTDAYGNANRYKNASPRDDFS